MNSTDSTPSRVAGSYHWNSERALAIVSIPLLTSAFVLGPVPVVDAALGVVMPLHIHLGLACIIDDYLPKRRAGSLVYSSAKFSLWLSTALALYGCYQFNTNDVGLTAFVKRLWTGKVKEE